MSRAPLAPLYSPLTGNTGFEIRVLTLLPPVSTSPDPIRLTIREVSLLDLTDGYVKFFKQSRLDDARVPSSEEIIRDTQYRDEWLQRGRSQQLGERKWLAAVQRFNWGDFYALSYVWGPSEQKRAVIVDDHVLPVTDNLFAALSRIRDYRLHRLGICLWVDALCIDQRNLAERAVEVRKMATLYHAALGVHVWLGEPSSPLFPFSTGGRTARLHTWSGSQTNPERPDGSGWTFWEQSHVHELDDRREVALKNSQALLELLHRPYWKRLWVIQEICHANTGSSFCIFGPLKIGLYELEAARARYKSRARKRFSSNESDPPPDDYAQTDHLIQLALDRRRQRSATGRNRRTLLDVWNVFTAVSSAQAADYRDRVYGILGLLPPEMADRIVPNYGAGFSERDAYLQLSQAYFSAYNDFAVLEGLPAPAASGPPNPSWLLDLPNLDLSGLEYLDDDGVSRADQASDVRFQSNGEVMICRCWVLDTVAAITDRAVGLTMAMTSRAYISDAIKYRHDVYSFRNLKTLASTYLAATEGGQEHIARRSRSLLGLTPAIVPSPSAKAVAEAADKLEDKDRNPLEDWYDISRDVPALSASFTDDIAEIVEELVDPSSNSSGGEMMTTLASPQLIVALQTKPPVHRHRVYITSLGALCFGPETLQAGDVVALFPTCRSAIALRRSAGDRTCHTLVGACYLPALADVLKILAQAQAGEQYPMTEIQLR